MKKDISLEYRVESLTRSDEENVVVNLYKSDGTQGSPVTLNLPVAEAKGFFPGELFTITLTKSE